jgi:hypothetical protein
MRHHHRSAYLLIALFTAAVFVPPNAVQAGGTADCASVDRTSNEIADFWENHCSRKINVSWVDEGFCKDRCGLAVAAHSKESASKAKGRVRWAACYAPALVEESWRGEGPYKCE